MVITTGIAWFDHILDLATAIDENTVTPHFQREPLPGDHVLGELGTEHKKLYGTVIRFLELAGEKMQEHQREHPVTVHDQPSCEKCFDIVYWLRSQADLVNHIFWMSFWYDRRSMPTPAICIRNDWKIVENREQAMQMAYTPSVSGKEQGH